jgi:hypothetical protein
MIRHVFQTNDNYWILITTDKLSSHKLLYWTYQYGNAPSFVFYRADNLPSVFEMFHTTKKKLFPNSSTTYSLFFNYHTQKFSEHNLLGLFKSIYTHLGIIHPEYKEIYIYEFKPVPL